MHFALLIFGFGFGFGRIYKNKFRSVSTGSMG